MSFRDRLDATDRRGQAMVEFALVLPILVLLLVLAVDFGRVFFQWVGVSNASRIAANYAARNPDAWDSTPDVASQNEYRLLVARDLNPLNCLAPDDTEYDATDVPNPTFTGYEVGDQTSASIQCRFSVLTPIAALFVGGQTFTVTAESTFTVNGGRISGIPVGVVPPEGGTGGTPCADVVVPNLVNKTIEEAEALWSSRFSGAFTTSPPGALPDDVVASQTTTPASSPGACVLSSMSVTVTYVTATACDPGEARIPSLIDLTVAAARTKWSDAGFTGQFYPATGLDSEVVTSQNVSSGDDPGECAPTSALVTVGSEPAVDYCVAAQLTGSTKAQAQAAYTGAGFTGTIKFTGPASGVVTGQKLTGGATYPCSSNEDLKLSNK
ncbi:MAG TPA: TadE/TadG family type IV pilus assembly protein [Rhodothermales bacterium]|jgi:Flp pilus assembly protein TadG